MNETVKFDGAITRSVVLSLFAKAMEIFGPEKATRTTVAKLINVTPQCIDFWIKRCDTENPVHAKSTIRRVSEVLNSPLAELQQQIPVCTPKTCKCNASKTSTNPTDPKSGNLTDPKYWQALSTDELAAVRAAMAVAMKKAKRDEALKKIYAIAEEANRNVQKIVKSAGIRATVTLYIHKD